jgi:thiosulfate dehydrogenase (quinone) large subunit
MLSRDARWIAAAVQVVIAWEWLVSGVNKLLSGTFPQGLASTLNDGAQNNPNGWYVAILQGIVIPHSVAFGYAIEATEILIAVALIVGAVVLVGPIRLPGTPQHRLAVGEITAATIAALLCAFLCVNFHFYMGDSIIPWFNSAKPFDEGITLDTLMPPLSVVILPLNLWVLTDMTETRLSKYVRRWVGQLYARASSGSQSDASPVVEQDR